MNTRLLLGLFTVLMLFGCTGLGGPGPAAPTSGGSLIPDKADGYAVIKLSAIMNDKEFLDAIEKGSSQSIEEQLARAESESGINFKKTEAFIIFFDTDRMSGTAADQYIGGVFIGEYNKDTLLAKMKENNAVTEEKYEGYTLYLIESQNGGAGSSLFSNGIAFIDDKTIIFGTKFVLRDVIDVKNGKQKALDNANLNTVTGAINKDAMLVVASRIPESARATISEEESGPVSTAAFKKINTVGLSLNKAGESVELKVAMLFDDANSAEKASKAVTGIVNMYSALVKSGSSLETLLNAIKTSADGTLVKVELSATMADLKSAGDEISEMSQPSQPQPTPEYPEYNPEGNENFTTTTTFDLSGKTPRGTGTQVTIVECSDYQCPYCGRVEPTVTEILKNYEGKVSVYFKHFPLGFHQYAQKAAEAAECAADQGKFWEYHDKLFDNQNALTTTNLKQYASDLGLDTATFDSCLDDGDKADVVAADVTECKDNGVSGTPTFFINGNMLVGAQPYDAFKTAVDSTLNG